MPQSTQRRCSRRLTSRSVDIRAPDGSVEYDRCVIRCIGGVDGWTGVSFEQLGRRRRRRRHRIAGQPVRRAVSSVGVEALLIRPALRSARAPPRRGVSRASRMRVCSLPSSPTCHSTCPRRPAWNSTRSSTIGVSTRSSRCLTKSSAPPTPRTRQSCCSNELRRRPNSVAAVVAVTGETPIATGRVEFHAGTEFASLWGAGTVAAWRRRGVFRSLVAYRAALAAARGFRYLQVDALPESRPILQRLGFVELATTTPFVHAGITSP